MRWLVVLAIAAVMVGVLESQIFLHTEKSWGRGPGVRVLPKVRDFAIALEI